MARVKKPAFFGAKIVEIYRQTLAVLKENPTILLLFLFIALLDGIALTLLFLSHSEPVSYLLAPAIRTLYSERFLHYPANFVLLPKLFNHAHFLIISVFGILVTGITIKKIEASERGEKLPTLSAAGPALRKYFPLLLVWVASYFVLKLLGDWLMPRLPQTLAVQSGTAFLLALLTQSLFAFLMPAILIAGHGFLRDIGEGLWTAVRHLLSVMILVALPIFCIVVLSVFKAFAPIFANGSYPETVLWILGIGILISMFVDLFVTASTTLLYLKVRKSK